MLSTRVCVLVLTLPAASCLSTLIGSRWRIKLDLGLEPGSWMPNTIEGWGASGSRCIVNVDVEFDADAAETSEELVGPAKQTRVLTALNASSIVTLQGEQQVTFTSGGWCVQRRIGWKDDEEGELRFWLDCESGCTRGDVSVPVGERIFFCTSCFDDANGVKTLVAQQKETTEKLAVAEAQVEQDAKDDANEGLLAKALNMRQKINRQEELQVLGWKKAFFERELPDLGIDQRPAHITPGSLSLQRSRGVGPFARASYHILGRFSAEPVAFGAAEWR